MTQETIKKKAMVAIRNEISKAVKDVLDQYEDNVSQEAFDLWLNPYLLAKLEEGEL